MLFFFFGWGEYLKELRLSDERRCPRCHNTSAWMRVRRGHQITVFFLPVLRWGRTELEACPICGEAVALQTAARPSWRARHAQV